MDSSPRVLLFLALVAACSNAGTAQWVQYGPPGASGSVSSILKAGTALFASTPGGGVSRSTNNGLSWQTANNGLTNLNVSSLAAVGNKVFAATVGAGIFGSTDGGVSWGPTGPLVDPTNLLISNNIVALATAGTTSSGTCRRSLAELLLSLGIGNSPEPPSGFALSPNYPNPFNPSTRISYTVPEEGFVRLFIYDALGREIERLVNGRMPAGTHTTEWHPSAASGVYFYRIEVSGAPGGARSFAATRKMILLR